MASVVEICNVALQKLGAGRIVSLTQDDPRARDCNLAYEPMRDAELRAHPWSFAKTRTVLAPDATAPAFDFDYQFTLPSDCVRVLMPNTYDLDWHIEGGKILTNEGDSINLIYLKRVTDPNVMDALFREMLSCRIALQLCEVVSQSNTKKVAIQEEYKKALAEARRANAIERVSDDTPVDAWIMARL